MFEQTIQKTNVWLAEVMNQLGADDKHKAYSSIRASLHALRDRLTVEEAANLGAQLPMLIRGLYYEGWRPTGKPLKQRSREEFLRHVEDELKDPTIEPEAAARATFVVLSKFITHGEIEDVKRSLPAEIRALWR